jgi:hypothetical protein
LHAVPQTGFLIGRMSFFGYGSIVELKAESKDFESSENEAVAGAFEGLCNYIVFSGDRFHCSENCKTTECFNLVVANYKNIDYDFKIQRPADCFSVLSTLLLDFNYDQNLYKTVADIILLIGEAVENHFYIEAVAVYEYFHHFLRHLPTKETPDIVVEAELSELSN